MNMQFTKGFPGGFTPVYPIDRAQIREIQRLAKAGVPNGLVSLRVGRSHGTSCPAVLRSDAGLRESLDEILAVRKLVEDGEYAFEFMDKYWFDDFGPTPDHFPKPLVEAHRHMPGGGDPISFDNPKGCAQIVRMDHPGDLHRVIYPWMATQGFVYKGAERDSFDFVDIAAEDDKVAAAAREVALEKAFDIKWYRGGARPEEVAGDVSITAYPEGCPGHAESYAGHAAFSESTARHFITHWREIGTNGQLRRLPQWAIKELIWAAYCFAQWRAFAAMHFAPSNVEPFGEAHEYGYVRAAA